MQARSVEDSRRFYGAFGVDALYVEGASSKSSHPKLALNKRPTLAEDPGVPADGTGHDQPDGRVSAGSPARTAPRYQDAGEPASDETLPTP